MRRDIRRSGVFTRRALLMMGGQVALLGGLAARLYQVQVVDGTRYATLAEENRALAGLDFGRAAMLLAAKVRA